MGTKAILVACLTIIGASCTEPGISPARVSVDRTYVLSACPDDESTGGAPPCVVHFTPHSIKYVDSARINIKVDGSFLWIGSGHTDVCTLGQNCQPRPHLTTHDTMAGLYTIQRDTLTFGLTRSSTGPNEAVEAYGLLAPGARQPWPGPDSMVVHHYQNARTTIYRPK